jgi:hypothetical protein
MAGNLKSRIGVLPLIVSTAVTVASCFGGGSPGQPGGGDGARSIRMTFVWPTYRQMGLGTGGLPGTWTWDGDGGILRIATPKDVELIAVLKDRHGQESPIGVWREGGTIALAVENPGTGPYQFAVFAKRKTDRNPNYTGVATYALVLGKPDPVIPGAPPGLASPDVFTAVDRYALGTPASAAQSMETLAPYLARGARNDLEKVRVIYRWMTDQIAYDADAFFKGDVRAAADAEEAFRHRKGVCDGYAGIYVELARLMGVKAKKVSGFAKGYGHDPAARLPDRSNHAWVAVRLDSGWYLLDPTWGSGSVTREGFHKKYEEGYFLTPPEQFIYTHLPERPDWQLLPQPWTRAEYAERIELRPRFFRTGLALVQQKGMLEFKSDFRVDVRNPRGVPLLATLSPAEGGKPRDLAVSAEGDRSVISGRAGPPGKYRLDIFAQSAQKKTGNTTHIQYEDAATYLIVQR